MKIAILGATSQIARDLIVSFNDKHELMLFGRNNMQVEDFMQVSNLSNYSVHSYNEILSERGWYPDVVINFVGASDPQQIKEMDSGVFSLTEKYDGYALSFLRKPETKYIFISSGAAYGDNFDKPIDKNSTVVFPASLTPQYYYGMAKYQTECTHRMINRPIVDLRVFSYFSNTQNINQKFMLTDMLRAIKNNEWFSVNNNYMCRDYLSAQDFHNIVNAVIEAEPINRAFNCYSAMPIEKDKLLEAMATEFGLKVEVVNETLATVTGVKPYYYTVDRELATIGYAPTASSLDTVLSGARSILNRS